MIPQFPNFKKLERTDREEVESFTKNFPPYSDFNFSTIWAWDVDETIKLSILHDNLILLLNDYTSDKHYLTFIGKNKINETASELLEFSMEGAEPGILKYVPEEVATGVSDLKLEVTLDEDNCDYILSVNDLANIENGHGHLGQNCRKFIRNNGDNIREVSCSIHEADKTVLAGLFERWAANKGLDYPELVEYKAFERYFQIDDAEIKVLSIYDGNKLIGFEMFEIISNKFIMGEFRKADVQCRGFYQFSE